jgi:hypothetical protein
MDATRTNHSTERAIERMAQAGLNASAVLNLAGQVARSTREATAVLIVTLPERAGDDRDDVLTRESNGNEVWSINRDGRIITLMLRRSNQPHTADAMRVNRVMALRMADGKVRAAELK